MGLAENGRLLMLDKRGTGLSDRVAGVPTLETRMDDVRAVMDAVGSERAVMWSGQEGTRMTTLFAATYPERTAGLVVLDPTAKGLPTPDYPWAPTEAEWGETLRGVREHWGERDFLEGMIRSLAPTMADDPEFCDWFVTHMRRSLSPGAAAAFFRMMMDADVSDVLPAVRVPTLILFSTPKRGPAEYFFHHIPHAEMVELPNMQGDYTWIDDDTHERTMAAVRDFVAGLHRVEEPDRILATLLFTDIVKSTATQAELGDRGGRTWCSGTTPSCGTYWRGTAAPSRTPPETGSMPASTDRPEPCSARSRSCARSARSASRSARASTRASASWSTGSAAACPSPSALVWRRRPARPRCSSRRR